MMTTGSGSFRGQLRALTVADILGFLRGLNRRGLLTLSAEGTVVGLYLREGRVIHATSTRDGDRLTELLLRDGAITGAQLETVLRRAAGGERIGKALVATGAITPRGLMEARARQVRQIVVSLFEWDAGEFLFTEGDAPADEGLAVELPLLDLIAQGIRSVRTEAILRERIPSSDWVFDPISGIDRETTVALEPQEESVLRLVDGTRSVEAIVAASEFPETETLRILFLLSSIGYTRMKAQPGGADEPFELEAIAAIVGRYNGMLGRVHQYMTREVGPISGHLLAKSLSSTKGDHPVVFSRSSLGGDGTIDAEVIQDNVKGLAPARRHEAVVQGLNELLYAELLVLRRALGAEHEARLLRTLRGVPGYPEAPSPVGR